MVSKVCLYARVSTDNQELDLQVEKLTSWAEEKGYEYDLYSEKVSSIKQRPELEKIMSKLDEYNKLVVTKIDRFARSVIHLDQRINKLRDNDVEFEALDQPIKTDDEIFGDFILKQIALYGSLERKMIRRRLEEGFKKAMEEGRVGRPAKIQGKAGKKVLDWYKQGATYPFIVARLESEFNLDVSRSSVYRFLKKKGVIGE